MSTPAFSAIRFIRTNRRFYSVVPGMLSSPSHSRGSLWRPSHSVATVPFACLGLWVHFAFQGGEEVGLVHGVIFPFRGRLRGFFEFMAIGLALGGLPRRRSGSVAGSL